MESSSSISTISSSNNTTIERRATPVVSKKKKDTFSNEGTNRSDSVEIRMVSPRLQDQGSNLSADVDVNQTALVAVHDIEPGEKLFAERPFICYSLDLNEKDQLKSIRSQISKMTRNQASALSLFFSLGNSNSSSYSKDIDIVDRFVVQYNSTHKGLFVLTSKVRHSCSPNAEISISAKGVAVAHATRFIPRGTEITANKIDDLNLAWEMRKAHHKSIFSVKCTCFVCVQCLSEASLREADDILRSKIFNHESEFYALVQEKPFEAISVAHKLIGILIQSAKSSKHFFYTDIPLLRRIHLRVATLSMKHIGSLPLSIQHLKLATTYCALGIQLGLSSIKMVYIFDSHLTAPLFLQDWDGHPLKHFKSKVTLKSDLFQTWSFGSCPYLTKLLMRIFFRPFLRQV